MLFLLHLYGTKKPPAKAALGVLVLLNCSKHSVAMHAPPLVAIATVPPRGNQECANEVYRKAISLACPLGKVPSEARRNGVARGL